MIEVAEPKGGMDPEELEGRELDLAVAEEVMGWGIPKVCSSVSDTFRRVQARGVRDNNLRVHPGTGGWRSVPYYSSPNFEVQRVLDQVRKTLIWEIKSRAFKAQPKWMAKCGIHDVGQFYGDGETFPEAVCRSALKAAQEGHVVSEPRS